MHGCQDMGDTVTMLWGQLSLQSTRVNISIRSGGAADKIKSAQTRVADMHTKSGDLQRQDVRE